MLLLIPLTATTLLVRGIGLLRSRRTGAPDWHWSIAVAWGLSALFTSTSITHFLPPHREGLVAIVPRSLPAPEVLVTVTGIAEALLAVGLVTPRTRTVAAAASIALLAALFPANVVAAHGVDNPHAPGTALVPRLALQLVFAATATLVLIAGLPFAHRLRSQ